MGSIGENDGSKGRNVGVTGGNEGSSGRNEGSAGRKDGLIDGNEGFSVRNLRYTTPRSSAVLTLPVNKRNMKTVPIMRGIRVFFVFLR